MVGTGTYSLITSVIDLDTLMSSSTVTSDPVSDVSPGLYCDL